MSAEAFLHDSAIVDDGAEIGSGTRIWHWVHVCSTAQIGKNCVLGQNVFVGNNVKVGDGVKIQNNVSIYEGVVLEDDVFCGPSMVFTNVINPRSHIERKTEFKETRIGKGATLGANSTVICGNSVGAYAMVGASALVSKPVPAYALVLGVPARQVGWVCSCGERLPAEAEKNQGSQCGACNKSYAIKDGICIEV